MSTKILLRTTSNKTGFTLIELLVVVALIGLITLFALPSVTSYFKISLNASAREMASIVKEAYNSAVMTGKVNRLVYDLDQQAFWVESGPSTLLLDTAESKAKEERRRRFSLTGEVQKSSPFSINRSVTRKEHTLPRGVEFTDVLTEQTPDPILSGKAYTHIFPHGLTEQTIIHLKDNSSHQITLVISALTGQIRLIERYVNREEAYGH